MTNETIKQETALEVKSAEHMRYGSREFVHEKDVSKVPLRDNYLVDRSGRILRRVDYLNGFYIVQPLLDKEEKRKIADSIARYSERISGASIRYDNEIAHARSIGLAHQEYEDRFVKPKKDLELHRSLLSLEEPDNE